MRNESLMRITAVLLNELVCEHDAIGKNRAEYRVLGSGGVDSVRARFSYLLQNFQYLLEGYSGASQQMMYYYLAVVLRTFPDAPRYQFRGIAE